MVSSNANVEGRIDRVERQKKNSKRMNIYVNGEFAFAVHEDIMVKYRLLKGRTIQSEDLKDILCAEEFHRAEQAGLKYLGYRPRTEKEMRAHLRQKDVPVDTIETLIEQFKEKQYLNDERYARAWVEERMRLKPRGLLKMKQELMQKGVEEWIIDSALAQIDPNDEMQAALKDAEKKWSRMKKEPGYKMKAKLGQHLQSKGYTMDVIRNILERFHAGDEDA